MMFCLVADENGPMTRILENCEGKQSAELKWHGNILPYFFTDAYVCSI